MPGLRGPSLQDHRAALTEDPQICLSQGALQVERRVGGTPPPSAQGAPLKALRVEGQRAEGREGLTKNPQGPPGPARVLAPAPVVPTVSFLKWARPFPVLPFSRGHLRPR